MSHEDKECCGCCCYGPQGPQGVMGMQGPQGPQGPSGQNGVAGPVGPMGPQGIAGAVGAAGAIGPQGAVGPQGAQGSIGADGQMGPQGPQGAIGPVGAQGPQGIQGIPGRDCDCSQSGCCERYLNIYASQPLIIGPYNSASDAVVFNSMNAVSVGDFDLSQMSITGAIKILKHGIYHLQWELQGRIEPPVPDPVPSWSFGFWMNGVLVPGSIYSGFTQAPGDDACHSTGDVIVEVKAGDILMLRNTSVSNVVLNPNINGSVFPITIASITIECQKALA